MADRLINIFLLFALVFIFILFGEAEVHNRTIIAFAAAAVLSISAFIFNWLTIDGTVAAIIFGTISFGLGGIIGAAVVLTFFITGSILSKEHVGRDGFLEKKFRRDGSQVWANGFWFAILIMVWFLAKFDGYLVAAIAGIAMATADTWATEIGSNRIKANTKLITTGEKVVPGTDGGISLYGSLAAICGALLIALVYLGLYPGATIVAVLIIFISGIAGCFIDSYLGARIQHRTYRFKVLYPFGYQNLYVSNNLVNWISSGLASLIALILTLIFRI